MNDFTIWHQQGIGDLAFYIKACGAQGMLPCRVLTTNRQAAQFARAYFPSVSVDWLKPGGLRVLFYAIRYRPYISHRTSNKYNRPIGVLMRMGVIRGTELHGAARQNLTPSVTGVPYGHLARRAIYHCACARLLSLRTLKYEIASRCAKGMGYDVLIHPGSGKLQSFKRWPTGHYRELLGFFARTGIRVAMTFGPDEAGVYDDFARLVQEYQNVTLFREPSFAEIAELLSSVRLVVASDISIGHIAALHSVDTISLIGPSDPNKTRPLNDRLHVVMAHHRPPCSPCITRNRAGGCGDPICMSGIQVHDVIEAIGRVLEISV